MLLAPRPSELREAAPRRDGCWPEFGPTVRTQPTNCPRVLYLRTKAARTAVALPGIVTSTRPRRHRSRRWPVAALRTPAHCAQMDRGLARRPGSLQNVLLAVRRISPVSATPTCAGTRRRCAASGHSDAGGPSQHRLHVLAAIRSALPPGRRRYAKLPSCAGP